MWFYNSLREDLEQMKKAVFESLYLQLTLAILVGAFVLATYAVSSQATSSMVLTLLLQVVLIATITAMVGGMFVVLRKVLSWHAKSLYQDVEREYREQLRQYDLALTQLRDGDPDACDFYAAALHPDIMPVQKLPDTQPRVQNFYRNHRFPIPTASDLLNRELQQVRDAAHDEESRLLREKMLSLFNALKAREPLGYQTLIDHLAGRRELVQAAITETEQEWFRRTGHALNAA